MSLFNHVKANISIVDVIAEYVHLKPAGGYLKGPCPFHSEKDASFTVSPEKNIFYCFGCQTTGDVISFIARIENLSQLDAMHHLIDRYKITIPQELLQKTGTSHISSKEKELFFTIHEHVGLWAHQQLLHNQQAKTYLSNRGFTPETIKSFTIGYFPGGINNLNLFLRAMAHQGIMAKDLLETGILAEGRNAFYSSFEERIMFPIHDTLGRPCGFGGRIFKQQDDRAKYYNSKESDVFTKGKILFGFNRAKKAMQEKEFAFLVEGYLDCIAMAQHGYLNTVATLGTACTIDHLKLLARNIKTLYVLYDGDQAGQNAMLRLTELCWEVNLELHVIQLPAQEDPASFLISGGDLTPYILNAQTIFSFFVTTLCTHFAQKSLSEKVTLAEKITNIIARIQDEFKQDILLQQAAHEMQLPLQSLKNLTIKQRHRHSIQERIEKPQHPMPPHEETEQDISLLEEKIISAILNSTEKNQTPFMVEDDLLPYFSTQAQILLKIYKKSVETSPTKPWETLINTIDEQIKPWVVQISLKYEWNDNCHESIRQLILHFCKVKWKILIKTIKDDMHTARINNNVEHLNALLEHFLTLKQGLQIRGLI
ncbi:MAG: primase protein [candidate division TM6 bacterium GW2011_GWF2_38_10]|nr:MAG: primase protein [candidate division TM6 bacterium GW2011_GWF2_38_10]